MYLPSNSTISLLAIYPTKTLEHTWEEYTWFLPQYYFYNQKDTGSKVPSTGERINKYVAIYSQNEISQWYLKMNELEQHIPKSKSESKTCMSSVWFHLYSQRAKLNINNW